jgi:hypothetical protein
MPGHSNLMLCITELTLRLAFVIDYIESFHIRIESKVKTDGLVNNGSRRILFVKNWAVVSIVYRNALIYC